MASDCCVEWCDAPARRRGYCGMHYGRLLRGQDMDAPKRNRPFWGWVDGSGGLDSCWPWIGARDQNGYGRISARTYGQQFAHRHAYSLAFPEGEMPEAVMHECDYPPCCNPLHLTGGTRLLNNQQAWARGLHPRGERHGGAVLSDEDVAEIRRQVAEGSKQVDVAREFAITASHVSRIVNFEVRRAA